MDTLVLWSNNQYGVISSANKQEIPLDRPMIFSIQPGEITLMAGLLEVSQSMADGETIRFEYNIRKLGDSEYEDYLGRSLHHLIQEPVRECHFGVCAYLPKLFVISKK